MGIYKPGSRIGQYEVVSKPMMGGMGVVYFALDHDHDGRPVALKTFRPELLPDREARDRFLREGTAWVNLGSHLHIVKCNAVEYIDPVAFLSLELIAKEQGMEDASLRSWMWSPMNVEQALLFALQIARGMRYATERIPGFVHRDLKPENILVGADKLPDTNVNCLRVTDFGLATMSKEEGGNLKSEENGAIGRTHLTRGIVGTPLYMAPEQWNNETVGMYTDIYAFGLILHEMLTGRHTVSGRTIGELQKAHCSGDIRIVPGKLSENLVLLLQRSFALKPESRYQTWDEVAIALEAVYASLGKGVAPNLSPVIEATFDEHRREASSYNAIGSSYLDMGKAQLAITFYEKSVDKYHEIGDEREERVPLGNLGVAYSALGNLQLSINSQERAIAISRKVNDQYGLGTSLGNLGIVYRNLGDMQNAIRHFEEQRTIAHKIDNQNMAGSALGNLGNVYLQLGDIQHSIKCYESALVIMHEIGNQRGEYATLGNLGLSYATSGDMKQAIGCYEKQLIGSRSIGDRRGECASLGYLGLAYAAQGNTLKAVDYYKNQLNIAREIGEANWESTALGNLGNAYQVLGELKLAIESYEKDLEISRKIGNINSVGTASLNMALLYAQQGLSSQALSLAKESAQAFTQTGNQEYFKRAQRLVEQLESNGAPVFNPAQAAFEVFSRTANLQDMQFAVKTYPIMINDGFIQAIEESIQKRIPPNLKPSFEQRLIWLKQIAGKQSSGFLGNLFGKK